VRKRTRKKAQPLDEDTMVALALSSSLLEREKELERQAAATLASVAPGLLQGRPGAEAGAASLAFCFLHVSSSYRSDDSRCFNGL